MKRSIFFSLIKGFYSRYLLRGFRHYNYKNNYTNYRTCTTRIFFFLPYIILIIRLIFSLKFSISLTRDIWKSRQIASLFRCFWRKRLVVGWPFCGHYMAKMAAYPPDIKRLGDRNVVLISNNYCSKIFAYGLLKSFVFYSSGKLWTYYDKNWGMVAKISI